MKNKQKKKEHNRTYSEIMWDLIFIERTAEKRYLDLVDWDVKKEYLEKNELKLYDKLQKELNQLYEKNMKRL